MKKQDPMTHEEHLSCAKAYLRMQADGTLKRSFGEIPQEQSLK
jgi:hypothetical protein